MQDIDHILDKTKSQLSKVEAPDYILTRAKQQLENLKEIATPKFIWSTAFATVVLLMFNVYVIGQHKTSNSNDFPVNQEAAVMIINSSNQLYADE